RDGPPPGRERAVGGAVEQVALQRCRQLPTFAAPALVALAAERVVLRADVVVRFADVRLAVAALRVPLAAALRAVVRVALAAVAVSAAPFLAVVEAAFVRRTVVAASRLRSWVAC